MNGNPLLSTLNFERLTLLELRQAAQVMAEVVETQLSPFDDLETISETKFTTGSSVDPSTPANRADPRTPGPASPYLSSPITLDLDLADDPSHHALPHQSLWVDTYNRLASRATALTGTPLEILSAEGAPEHLHAAIATLLSSLAHP